VNWRTLPRYEFDRTLDIVRAVREAVGEHVDILIEGHSRFSTAAAIEVATALAPVRPVWFEEPVPIRRFHPLWSSEAQPSPDRKRARTSTPSSSSPSY